MILGNEIILLMMRLVLLGVFVLLLLTLVKRTLMLLMKLALCICPDVILLRPFSLRAIPFLIPKGPGYLSIRIMAKDVLCRLEGLLVARI